MDFTRTPFYILGVLALLSSVTHKVINLMIVEDLGREAGEESPRSDATGPTSQVLQSHKKLQRRGNCGSCRLEKEKPLNFC